MYWNIGGYRILLHQTLTPDDQDAVSSVCLFVWMLVTFDKEILSEIWIWIILNFIQSCGCLAPFVYSILSILCETMRSSFSISHIVKFWLMEPPMQFKLPNEALKLYMKHKFTIRKTTVGPPTEYMLTSESLL